MPEPARPRDAAVLRVRPRTPQDDEVVRRAHREGLGPYVAQVWGWDEAVQAGFVTQMLAGDGPGIVEVDGRPAGYLDVVDRDDHVHLANVVLLPEFHGRGLGTRLLRRVLAHADARGVPVRLTVLRPNPARRLYERLGFVRTKEDEQRVWMERPCTLSREDP